MPVLHPGVRERIECDMDLLRAAGWALEKLPALRWLDPNGMLREFASLLTMQLDLRGEARNLETFRRNFPPPTSPIVFAQPLRPYVSRDVLVE